MTTAALNRVLDGDIWTALMADWLAGLFMAPPSPEAINCYRTTLGRSLFAELSDEPSCVVGAALMQKVVSAPGLSPLIARSLGVTFVTMFDGVGGPATVPLYESAYTGSSGRLFQAPTDTLGRMLRRADLAVNKPVTEPPDHLSIELALLAAMMRRTGTHHAQTDLLDGHLLVWVPHFALRCAGEDRTGFYAGAAAVLLGLLTAWRAALRMTGSTP